MSLLTSTVQEDVWFLPYEFQHRHLHDAFRELRGSVVTRLIRANWIDLALITFLSFLELAADYSMPINLQRLLKAMDFIAVDKKPAIAIAIIMALIRLADAQAGLLELWFQRRCYERSRGEMITMVHEKTLQRKIVGEKLNSQKNTNGHANGDATGTVSAQDQLNGQSKGRAVSRLQQARSRISTFFTARKTAAKEPKQPASMGKIINLMRNDVYEVSQRFWDFDKLVQMPCGLIISLILLWRLLGWACLFGVAVALLTQVLTAAVTRLLIKFERRRRAVTDTKLQRISQYVEAIRHLRWYGWEQAWLGRVMEARHSELHLRLMTMSCTVMITSITRFGIGLLPVSAFYAFTALAGRELSIEVAFPALQLFSMLQKNLQAIPELITILLNAKVAVGRIEDFMAEPDKLETLEVSYDHLKLEHATFSWPGTSHYVLRDVDLSFPQGLSLVVGVVGSGKTALLQAILGELDLESGNLIRPRDTPVAYCSQTPWLQSMSIRDNILFTQPYDEERYKQVLDACALLPDLATFQHGDLSPIGENGIGLSGGQKARVALARAIYSRANTLLLDDPISSLDQQTAEWIVKKCFTGSLVDGRSLVLITHRTDLFKGLAVQTVEVDNGTVRTSTGDTDDTGYRLEHTVSTVSHLEEQAKKLQDAAIPEKFEEEEHRAHGNVFAAVYWEYIKSSKFRWWFGMIIFATMMQALQVGQTWFIKEWSEAYNRGKEHSILWLQSFASVHVQQTPLSNFFNKLPHPDDNVYPWLQWYFIIVGLEAAALLISQCFMIMLTLSAARQLFREVMLKISNAPFRFYDVTPIGRLLNRLTSDVGTVDGPISARFMFVAWQGIAWVSSIAVFATVTPQFLLFSILLTGAFVWIFLTFLPASQSLRRLEMVSLSPLMSNFGALLSGLTTVRAFCLQPAFLSRVISVTDDFQKMDHFYWSVQGWLQYRFDTLSAASPFLLTVLAIYSNLTPGLTAFIL